MLFGEALLDRFPDGTVVPGGAPLNVTLHLRAFGLAPWLITAVGRDDAGERLLSLLTGAGATTDGVLRVERPTGIVDVALEAGEPTFAIRPGAAWDLASDDRPALPPDAALLYHGSLALRTPAARSRLTHLRAALHAPVLVDVNLRAPWWSRDHVRELIAGARWVKLNRAELALLADARDETTAARELLALGDSELVVVTHGAAGAAGYTADGRVARVRGDGPRVVLDSVGAGDAFAAVMLCGLLRGWPLAMTLERADAFARRTVGCRGAVPGDPGIYAATLAAWGMAPTC